MEALRDAIRASMDLPHAVKRARRYLFDHSRRPSQAEFSDALPDEIAVLTEHAEASLAPIIAAVEAHLDATKREPLAGLVEVIRSAITRCDYGMGDVATTDDLAPAIARAVVEFATSNAAIERAAVACDGTPAGHDDTLYMIRAALGVKEEGK